MIGRYRVIQRLGQGGYGRVYLARDDDLDRPIAIKVPNRNRIARPEDVETFLIEARNLARLDHPNIVPVFDVGRTEDGLCFVVSKFVEGTSTCDTSAAKFLSPRRLACQTAIALAGDVVSKPTAKKTTVRAGFCSAIRRQSSGE